MRLFESLSVQKWLLQKGKFFRLVDWGQVYGFKVIGVDVE